VFGIAALGCVVTAVVVPRTYAVDTKILAQRNLVMPSLGNPRRSVPMDSDAPTRAAADVILGRENLVALIDEAHLVARWESDRAPLLRLKDQLVSTFGPPVTEEDKVRALVSVLEKKLYVQADDSTIRIGIEWQSPETAYELVSLAQRNFFAGRSAIEVAVIGDTIAILNVEAGRQREAVDTAFASVLEISHGAAGPAPSRSRASSPTVTRPASPASPAPATATAPPVDTRIATRLDEKRQAIRELDAPRQQHLAELEARRARLLLTYTDAHPEVRQLDSELAVARVEPPALATLRKEEQELVAELGAMAAPERPRAAPERPRAAARASAGAPSERSRAAAEPSSGEDPPELAAAKERLLVATRRYEDLMDRIDSARIELQTAQAAFKYRYVVVDPPEIPQKATRPAPLLLLLGGLILSAVLAIFVTAAKDLTGGRFVEAWQVRRKLSLPVLAEIDAVR
jgi:uncharacterized protein involved in exopolysaccharide biosynthesis